MNKTKHKMKVNTKQEAIKILSDLPEKVIIRIAELSNNTLAKETFSCPIKFALLKASLK